MAADLNVMIREQALAGLNAQLDAATTAGDIAAVREVTGKIAQFAVQTAPKAPAFTNDDITAAVEAKADWYGVDPKKSKAVVDFGKTMNPKKFATAEAFAEAIIKAVDAEFPPPKDPDPEGEEENEDDDAPPPVKKPRKTDAPADDLGPPRAARSGPWTKLSDAPNDVRAEIKRSADKFAPKTEKGRADFEKRALESHYAAHLRAKGKK